MTFTIGLLTGIVIGLFVGAMLAWKRQARYHEIKNSVYIDDYEKSQKNKNLT